MWAPFFTLFWRHWPDCPFPVYLGTTVATHYDDRVKSLPAGDYPWSKTFRLTLERLDTEYALVFLEDFFLKRSISTAGIIQHLHVLQTLGGTVLRLHPMPPPDTEVDGHSSIGRIHRLAPYRVSLQPALWNRRALVELIRDEESIWDFESHGTIRSRSSFRGFYSTYRTALPHRHVVERGEWFWAAARYYRNQDIGCDFSARPTMSLVKAFKKALNRFRKNSTSAMSNFVFRRSAWLTR